MRSSASSRPSPSAHPAPRRRRRHGRRLFCLTVLACCVAGCIAFALSQEPQAAASSAASQPATSSSDAENGLLTAAQAQAMLDDPRMVLVNHTHKLADGYTITTKKCGSSTAINKDLQTEAADAFFAMQLPLPKDGVDHLDAERLPQRGLPDQALQQKTQYFRDQGCSEADARAKAAATIVNPPGYSEHNCGLAADLNSPEHTGLDEGFENTAAFRWLCQHAVEYGFILRYPKEAEAVTEITYEPWHWRYVGPENAALISQSGLCFEDAIAVLQKLAAGESHRLRIRKTGKRVPARCILPPDMVR